MIQQLSILIPTYNDLCAPQVQALSDQASCITGLEYEIIVADDGSTNASVITQNQAIGLLPCCRYLRREQNSGRAAIRNVLAGNARYEWLLFLDSQVELPNAFLCRYVSSDTPAQVICGGVAAGTAPTQPNADLRHKYEQAWSASHDAKVRNGQPYNSFRTTNFIISRDVMLAHPFDEHFDGYGYEDVLFGKTLAEHQISILHIDNAVSIAHYEPNPLYINKVEESLRTLSHHRQQIGNYSRLIRFQQRASWACLPLKAVFRMTRKPVRARLCKPNPPLWMFRFYQLGYYLCLRE